MSKDNSLAGQCFDITTNAGADLELCLKPYRDHYVIEVLDVVTQTDALPHLGQKPLPEIYSVSDLNIALQILFEDEEDPPQVTHETRVSDWVRGQERDDIAEIEDQAQFLQDVAFVVRDLEDTTLHDAIDRSGTDFFFRYGDVVARVSFRYSPAQE